jgi:hypothetical protein
MFKVLVLKDHIFAPAGETKFTIKKGEVLTATAVADWPERQSVSVTLPMRKTPLGFYRDQIMIDYCPEPVVRPKPTFPSNREILDML